MAERIDVYYSRINLPEFIENVRGPAYHKYLIYTDKSGQRHILRGGPDSYGPDSDAISPPINPHIAGSFGPVRFLDRQFDGSSPEFAEHTDSLGELLLEGDDLSESWSRMRSAFHDIEQMGYPYWPQGVNSNTIVDATLARSGHPPTRRDGTAGNSVWVAPDGSTTDVISTPGYNRLPQPPEYYERRRKLQGNKKVRSRVPHPADLIDLDDDEFAQVTQGPSWRRIWER